MKIVSILKVGRAFLVAGTILCAGTGAASENVGASAKESKSRFIVVLKPEAIVNGPGRVEEPDVERHGGATLARWGRRRSVSLPEPALQALACHRAVDYIERIRVEEVHGMSQPAIITCERGDDALTAQNEWLENQTWDSGDYSYDARGNIKAIGADSFEYDAAGRVERATLVEGTQTYAYDSFGNLSAMTTNGQTTPFNVDLSTNRLKGAEYDIAGNMVLPPDRDLGKGYVVDPLGMIVLRKELRMDTRYLYTADDERIAEESLEWKWSIRGFGGEVLSEFSSTSNVFYHSDWSWVEDYYYDHGRIVAAALPHGEKMIRHFHIDHLGTPRLITDGRGYGVARHKFYPFGEEITDLAQEWRTVRQDPHAHATKFTGHERDYVDDTDANRRDYLDYMHARYYNPMVGRFLSVDPVLDIKRALKSPQMWNRYSYVLNNPLRYVDPDGRLVQLSGSAEEQQKLLALIRQNLAEKDRNLVTIDKNGMLQIAASAKGSTVGFSMLKSMVRKKEQTASVGFAEVASVKPGPGPVRPMQVDLRTAGGGIAVGRPFSMSGNIEIRIDPRGSATGEPMGIVMGHELLGHGFDLMYRGLTSEHSARTTENLIRLDLGMSLRPNQIVGPWPDDPEHP